MEKGTESNREQLPTAKTNEEVKYFLLQNQEFILNDDIDDIDYSDITRLTLNSIFTCDLPDWFGWIATKPNGEKIKLRELFMSSNVLYDIPQSFGLLTNLQALHMSADNITSIPESFGSLINLKELDLSINDLTTLPESFGSLINLKKLDLSMNKLKTLPESFVKLTKLKELDLSDNQLMASSKLWKTLGSLINLRVLDLTENLFYMSQIPHRLSGKFDIVIDNWEKYNTNLKNYFNIRY